MNDDLAQVLDRLHQNSTQRPWALGAPTDTEARGGPLLAGTFAAGDRVFDTVTGVEGAVLDPRRPSSEKVILVWVRLVDGRLVMRKPGDLIPRPTPPGERAS